VSVGERLRCALSCLALIRHKHTVENLQCAVFFIERQLVENSADVCERSTVFRGPGNLIARATAWGAVVGAALLDEALIEKWFDGFEAVSAAPEVERAGGFAEIMVRRGRTMMQRFCCAARSPNVSWFEPTLLPCSQLAGTVRRQSACAPENTSSVPRKAISS
jgi:hypothetical protein